MISWHYTGDGALVLTAVVKDANRDGNPWGSPFYHSRRYEGFTRREATAMFRDSLSRDGLSIVRD